MRYSSQDPRHRSNKLLKLCKKEWKASLGNTPHLKLWEYIEQNKPESAYPELYDQSLTLVWLDSKEKQAPYSITLQAEEEGVAALNHAGEKLPRGIYIFVVTGDGIFAAPENPENWCHASLNAGNPVINAGELHLGEGGIIEEISFRSGHYHPKKKNARWWIRQLGPGIECRLQSAKISYYTKKNLLPGEKKRLRAIPYEEFMISKA